MQINNAKEKIKKMSGGIFEDVESLSIGGGICDIEFGYTAVRRNYSA